MPRLIRWVSLLILMTCTLIVSPIDRISDGWFTRRQAMSVTCSRPSTPPRSTKAPYSVMFLTTPSTAWPSVRLRDHLGALFGAAFFQDRAARHHDVAAAAVHLQDLERLLHAHQRAGVAHRAHIDLLNRQERHGAAQIDGEAALDATEDRALDALFLLVGLLQPVPGFFAAGHLAADDRLALASSRRCGGRPRPRRRPRCRALSPGLANSFRSTRPSIL